MIFSSLLFLFRFLPIVLVLYFAAPKRFRNLVLFIVSIFFYAWGEPVYILLMLVSILITWTGGLAVDHFMCRGRLLAARVSLALSVAGALSLLIFFKYANFILRTISSLRHTPAIVLAFTLPIGISFYTFQTISYIIDVYRGDARVQTNIISYGAYVTMFPQLIAGPIVQYRTIDAQLRGRQESAQEFALGVNRFIVGLGKKVLLANNAGAVWEGIRAMAPSQIPALTAWIGIAAFTFQIYFDFSAYSDMAIGLGHMFGFRFLENFNYPYESKSVTEFWRRWHISLGTWFREYVYIPLGGNRRGTAALLRNILVVWLLTGIWHGADWNFLIWGLYYAVILIFEKLFFSKILDKLPTAVRRIYCMLLVMFGWFIFSASDIEAPIGFLKAMFGQGAGLAGRGTVYLLYTNLVLFAILIIGSTSIPAKLAARLLQKIQQNDFLCVILRFAFYIAVFVLSLAYLVDASYNPFLYFRF